LRRLPRPAHAVGLRPVRRLRPTRGGQCRRADPGLRRRLELTLQATAPRTLSCSTSADFEFTGRDAAVRPRQNVRRSACPPARVEDGGHRRRSAVAARAERPPWLVRAPGTSGPDRTRARRTRRTWTG